MEHSNLPFGIQTFKKIREKNCLYVDKTEYISKMLNLSDFCFLSRPRRFGKSLLIDTIDELFRGDRKLFEGLWIDNPNNFDFKQHPVLNLCMTYTEVNQKADLIHRISDDLIEVADEESVKIVANSYGEILEELLQGLSEKYGVGAVILIDECDSPVTNNLINRMELALDCRDVLRDFYGAMKKSSKYIKFALVTGITRFTMMPGDYGSNNFMDISLEPEFAGICGFTPQELEIYFSDRFTDALAKLKPEITKPTDDDFKELTADILEWYDGYNWLGSERILNPYTILHFFNNFKFNSYWPMSGRPSYLPALVRENPRDYMFPNLEAYRARDFSTCDVKCISPIPVLFHSGYLTIDSKTTTEIIENNEVTKVPAFTFKIPN
ncbi:MAG: AAA family ATPase, partial [Deltaproteobacteria bacterium]|nr:AAA family ATPase [Deltaproteobacteria bacterium]